jgi:post-segregation antitoxin (ccd killing protein)
VIEEEIRRKKKAKPRALDSGRAIFKSRQISPELKEEVEEDKGFELSERAAQAAQVNMSARLAIVIEEEIRRKKKAKPRALDSGRAIFKSRQISETKRRSGGGQGLRIV